MDRLDTIKQFTEKYPVLLQLEWAIALCPGANIRQKITRGEKWKCEELGSGG